LSGIPTQGIAARKARSAYGQTGTGSTVNGGR
jgi:hypothetical protein